MIRFNPLWNTMKEKKVTQYMLIHKYGVSPGQITRLKRNESVSTHTIEMFCKILDCQVDKIMEYIKEENDTNSEKESPDFAENPQALKTNHKAAEPVLQHRKK